MARPKFLAKYIPKLENYFHHRMFDVRSFKIALSLWKPSLKNKLKKQNNHLALDDIKKSIKEIQFYRQSLLTGIDTN